jgi:hypothetical protein
LKVNHPIFNSNAIAKTGNFEFLGKPSKIGKVVGIDFNRTTLNDGKKKLEMICRHFRLNGVGGSKKSGIALKKTTLGQEKGPQDWETNTRMDQIREGH